MRSLLVLAVFAALASLTGCAATRSSSPQVQTQMGAHPSDVYLQYPKGSNNRGNGG